MAFLVAMAASCATLGAGSTIAEQVDLRLDPAEWVLGERSGGPSATLTGYVPANQSAEQWTRFVTGETYAYAALPFPAVDEAPQEQRSGLAACCPGLRWNVISRPRGGARYEWRTQGCEGVPDQHEVGRVTAGRRTWARIGSTVTGSMDAATRDEWIRRLEGARLIAPLVRRGAVTGPPRGR
ncbi:MAG TPA: hypothetical protein VFR37_10930 [Longimicrobium sp.]|nr:hypothetical protein [Longimicrobium sp.]